VNPCEHRDTPSGRKGLPRLLIVEPEGLLQWCLVEYLAQWFDVLAVGCEGEARQTLDAYRVDALVLSDELPEEAASHLEDQAHRGNPAIQVVRTVTDPLESSKAPAGAAYVEKPFKLADLAHLLGVEAAR
jgi:DNA-binding response OmpR family regulator